MQHDELDDGFISKETAKVYVSSHKVARRRLKVRYLKVSRDDRV